MTPLAVHPLFLTFGIFPPLFTSTRPVGAARGNYTVTLKEGEKKKSKHLGAGELVAEANTRIDSFSLVVSWRTLTALPW